MLLMRLLWRGGEGVRPMMGLKPLLSHEDVGLSKFY